MTFYRKSSAAFLAGLSFFWSASAANLESLREVNANLGPDCNFSMKIPSVSEFNSHYEHPWPEGSMVDKDNPPANGVAFVTISDAGKKFFFNPLELDFGCFKRDRPETVGGPLSFDTKVKKWVLDVDEGLRLSGIEKDSKELAEQRLRDLLIRSWRVYNLEIPGATGYAYVEDDTFGDESRRRRLLHFCIFHNSKAICNQHQILVGGMEDVIKHPKSDLTPYMVNVLNSIRFLPDSKPPEAAASAGGK